VANGIRGAGTFAYAVKLTKKLVKIPTKVVPAGAADFVGRCAAFVHDMRP
jgi:hypothetical protein